MSLLSQLSVTRSLLLSLILPNLFNVFLLAHCREKRFNNKNRFGRVISLYCSVPLVPILLSDANRRRRPTTAADVGRLHRQLVARHRSLPPSSNTAVVRTNVSRFSRDPSTPARPRRARRERSQQSKAGVHGDRLPLVNPAYWKCGREIQRLPSSGGTATCRLSSAIRHRPVADIVISTEAFHASSPEYQSDGCVLPPPDTDESRSSSAVHIIDRRAMSFTKRS